MGYHSISNACAEPRAYMGRGTCTQDDQLGPESRAFGDYFLRRLAASDANVRRDLPRLYFPQKLADFRHGAGCKPLVPKILFSDVEDGELSWERGRKINCEPKRMFRLMAQREGKENPARPIRSKWPEMRAYRANGNFHAAYQLLCNGSDQKLA